MKSLTFIFASILSILFTFSNWKIISNPKLCLWELGHYRSTFIVCLLLQIEFSSVGWCCGNMWIRKPSLREFSHYHKWFSRTQTHSSEEFLFFIALITSRWIWILAQWLFRCSFVIFGLHVLSWIKCSNIELKNIVNNIRTLERKHYFKLVCLVELSLFNPVQ